MRTTSGKPRARAAAAAGGAQQKKGRTIEELPDVLVLDSGRLLNSCGAERNQLDVVTLNLDLILAVVGNDTALVHLDGAHNLLAKEVADLDGLALVGDDNVDGEVSVHRLHGVLVAPDDADHHVLDVREDGPDNSGFL